jgi:D-glycerate 3-kinase
MTQLNSAQILAFTQKHQLPDDFYTVIDNHYLPLAHWLADTKLDGTEIIGISGAQGTGKTTLSDFLKLALETQNGLSIATLSLDDFYFRRSERKNLGKKIHPLLQTRGVPGTHNLKLCNQVITNLQRLEKNNTLQLPRFDKAQDDRFPRKNWPFVTGPIDIIILEGWCLGSQPQDANSLLKPLNKLEEIQDPDMVWRTYVNDQLQTNYSELFESFDKLIFLKAPGIKAVHNWRQEQEAKLAQKSNSLNTEIMDESQMSEFLQHYERLTRENLNHLSLLADVTMDLNEYHHVTSTFYREKG